jgi:hypothetical protein
VVMTASSPCFSLVLSEDSAPLPRADEARGDLEACRVRCALGVLGDLGVVGDLEVLGVFFLDEEEDEHVEVDVDADVDGEHAAEVDGVAGRVVEVVEAEDAVEAAPEAGEWCFEVDLEEEEEEEEEWLRRGDFWDLDAAACVVTAPTAGRSLGSRRTEERECRRVIFLPLSRRGCEWVPPLLLLLLLSRAQSLSLAVLDGRWSSRRVERRTIERDLLRKEGTSECVAEEEEG